MTRPAPRVALATCAVAVALVASAHATRARSQQQYLPFQGAMTVAAIAPDQANLWTTAIDQMQGDGTLVLRRVQEDTMFPGRLHERFVQTYDGVPVFGSEVVRETENGVALSVFGRLRANIDVDTTPVLSEADALRIAGVPAFTPGHADLIVVPVERNGYALCYRAQVFTGSQRLVTFVDAKDGAIVLQYDNLQAQSAVGVGTGVWGDLKKISTTAVPGGFVAQDGLRPPAIATYDLRGDRSRVDSVLGGLTLLAPADLAARPDNNWSDGAAVDAHVYAGWVYDYYWKRFGRHGLDDRNVPMVSLVHPVLRATATQASLSDPYYTNAFYDPTCKCIVYGDGLAAGDRSSEVKPFSAALDIVGHELTHAVTDASSQLIYRNESGALNEAFSDIIGTSIEFFYQPPGSGPLKADYQIGEDLLLNIRSLADPREGGTPDHYSNRYAIGMQVDNGGVHSNSTIAGHAFYLAVEGGTNRTSGLTVRGVGRQNREQIEKIFYRAFVYNLPANATFYMARVATIQAAHDLYGAGSAAESAVTQAWDAVGVSSPGAALSTAFWTQPVQPPSGSLSDATATRVTAVVYEFQGVGFTVTDYTGVVGDATGNILDLWTGTGADFAALFNFCGGAGGRIPPNGFVCADRQVDLGARRSGFVVFEFNGIDDNGNHGRFYSNVLGLGDFWPATGAWNPAATSQPAAAAQRKILQALEARHRDRDGSPNPPGSRRR